MFDAFTVSAEHFFGFFGIVPAPNLDENGDVARLAEAMEKGGKKGENGKKPFGLVEIEGLGHD